MKLKIFNLISVFLATSGLLTPAQAAVVNHSLERQTNVEKAQHLVWQAQPKVAKVTHSQKSSPITVVPPLLSPAQQKSVANILIGFIYFVLPCGLVLGIFLHDKYQVYRAAILQKQIELLERLYTLDNDATTDTGRWANEQIELLEKLWQSDSDNDATTDTGRGAKG
jgi:hypothetical protein